jgi:hypothetical protein
MDETHRRDLLKTTEAAIKHAKAELEKLNSFRIWLTGVGTTEMPLVGTVVAAAAGTAAGTVEDEPSTFSTSDFIEAGFLRAGVAAELTIPEIAQWATKAGWSSTSENPEQVVRTTIGTMLEAMRPRIELATPDQSGTRRYRLVGPRR